MQISLELSTSAEVQAQTTEELGRLLRRCALLDSVGSHAALRAASGRGAMALLTRHQIVRRATTSHLWGYTRTRKKQAKTANMCVARATYTLIAVHPSTRLLLCLAGLLGSFFLSLPSSSYSSSFSLYFTAVR